MNLRYGIVAIATMLGALPCLAQTGSIKTPSQLNSEINITYPNNSIGFITPQGVRQVSLDFVASIPFLNSANTFTALQSFPGGITGLPNPANASDAVNKSYVDSNLAQVSILQFGAVADSSPSYSGTYSTSNSTAMNSALATGRCVSVPFNENGYSFAPNIIVLGTAQCINFENGVLVKSQIATNGWLIHVTGFSEPSATGGAPAQILGNVHFDTNGSSPGTGVIRAATASGVIDGAQILASILCTHTYQCIGDESSTSNYVLSWTIGAVTTSQELGGPQIKFNRSRGFMTELGPWSFDRTESGQTLPVTWGGFEFDDFSGLSLDGDVSCTGPTIAQTTTYQSTSTCGTIDGLSGGSPSVFIRGWMLADNTSGNAWNLTNINYLQIPGTLESFQNLGTGTVMSGVTNFYISSIFTLGGVGLTGAASSSNGLSCVACNNGYIASLITGSNTGSGAVFGGSSLSASVGYMNAIANTGNALTLSGSSGGIHVQGGAWGSNGSALSNSSTGTGNIVSNVFGYNPVGSTASTNVGASPASVCAGLSPETHYLLQNGTNTAVVSQGGQQVLALSNSNTLYPINLSPNECYAVTWTTTQPTYTRIIH